MSSPGRSAIRRRWSVPRTRIWRYDLASRLPRDGRVRRTLRHRAVNGLGRAAGLVAVTLAGVTLGVMLGGTVTADIGPFQTRLSITPSITGGTDVAIPPLGSLHLRSHSGPAHLQIRLDSIDEARARAVVSTPNGFSDASDRVVGDLTRGIIRLTLQVLGIGLLGALLLAAVVYRNVRRIAASGLLALTVLTTSGGIAVTTARPDAILQPRYDGLLVNAPAIVGDARRIANRYEEYRGQLQGLVQNVSRLYGTISALPVYSTDSSTSRVLHISDLHLNPGAWSVVRTIVEQFAIDVVVDTGDITDWGSEPEEGYVASIAALKVPYLYIRGNHDSAATAAAVARQPNAVVLDNTTHTVAGLTFAGIADAQFTPDKSDAANDGAPGSKEENRRSEVRVGQQLADTIRASGARVDVGLVHDPVSAAPLAGTCPVVLAGHLHRREVRRLDGQHYVRPSTPTVDRGAVGDGTAGENGASETRSGRTLLMVEGSTGGAGLRGLENDDPLPLALSVMYFDSAHRLQAYDDIRVGGTGLTEVSLERHLVEPDTEAPPASPSRAPSGSPAADPSGTP
ncbi:MAG TPA: metallophosphoesterase [Micromonosporaceae bacterium]|nr:metallophosphoesterase [Micromonosporaceae bacterium]